jgi:3'-phosphoadenosine 5'-phosphosulfate (PAPS) 3'-phosphatase
MSRNAVGFNPASSMLSGLRGTPSYGKAMSAASELALETQTANAKQSLEDKTQENQRQDKKAGIYAQNANQGMQRQGKHKQHQMKQATDNSQATAGQLAINRKKHWDMKNSAIQGLLR